MRLLTALQVLQVLVQVLNLRNPGSGVVRGMSAQLDAAVAAGELLLSARGAAGVSYVREEIDGPVALSAVLSNTFHAARARCSRRRGLQLDRHALGHGARPWDLLLESS